ncbi:MAG: hypothetical protein F6J93_23455 [Oscillatoria sp. SIO1A7]|nr:hypothetical protein [Oscillatoria sp. SIO1A7]
MSSRKPNLGTASFWFLWFERLMALLALTNLGWVFFDMSYVKFRDFYLAGDLYLRKSRKSLPENYLAKVEELKKALKQNGVGSPRVGSLLQDLQQLSFQLFEENLFRMTDRYGAMKEIKKRLRDRMETNNIEQAVISFWSKKNLEGKWREELNFFDTNIGYLIGFYEPKLFYDPIKGIEPYRSTQAYLRNVAELKANIKENGLNSDRVEPLLEELRKESIEMIKDNPFKVAKKPGNLEEIKYRMKRHIYYREPDFSYPDYTPIDFVNSTIYFVLDLLAPEVLWAEKSSKEAFIKFWSQENLRRYRWEDELAFFEKEISFLLLANYYRHIGVYSDPINRFWLLDIPWIAFFLVEILVTTWWISHRQREVTWGKALAERWYDIFLVLPFWRWLRVISVMMRLDRVEFPDMDPIRAKIGQSFVGSFAGEITTAVVVRVIDQAQEAVEQGELAKALLEPSKKPKREYINFNEVNEIQAIGNRLIQITVSQALPTIQPELEAFLRYQIESAMKKSSLYLRIQRLPGLGRFPDQIAEGLVSQVSKLISQGPQNAYNASQNTQPDPIATELSQRLTNKFSSAIRNELQREHTIEELESLLSDLLEEIKINYVQKLTQTEAEKIVPAVKNRPQLPGS